MKPKLKTPRPAHRLPPEKLYARLDPRIVSGR